MKRVFLFIVTLAACGGSPVAVTPATPSTVAQSPLVGIYRVTFIVLTECSDKAAIDIAISQGPAGDLRVTDAGAVYKVTVADEVTWHEAVGDYALQEETDGSLAGDYTNGPCTYAVTMVKR